MKSTYVVTVRTVYHISAENERVAINETLEAIQYPTSSVHNVVEMSWRVIPIENIKLALNAEYGK